MTPVLLAISDTELAPGATLIERLERLCWAARAGAVALVLRDKQLSVRRRQELGVALRDVTRASQQWLCVADRLDLALALDADGLHLGEESIEPRDARRLWGPRFISRACHDPRTASAAGADAVVLSPVLAARKGAPALGRVGLTLARERCGAARLFALGGVDAHTARLCLEAGAHGVAAQGAVLDGRPPDALLAALGAARL